MFLFHTDHRSAFINVSHICNDIQLVDRWIFKCYCHVNTFFIDLSNSSITVSCTCICYEFHYSLGHIYSCSPQFLFKWKTSRCFSSELCSRGSIIYREYFCTNRMGHGKFFFSLSKIL